MSGVFLSRVGYGISDLIISNMLKYLAKKLYGAKKTLNIHYVHYQRSRFLEAQFFHNFICHNVSMYARRPFDSVEVK